MAQMAGWWRTPSRAGQLVRSMSRTTRILGLLAIAGVLVMAGVAVGFEAGRRYPFEFLNKYRPTPGNAFWTVAEETPFALYEGAAARVGDSVYVFGGFEDQDRNASRALHVYDAITNTWSRRRDMPIAKTHLTAAVVGRSVWFAGGFNGQHPGPVSDEVWRYDLDSDTWTAGPALPDKRGAGALVAIGSRLHYFGGYLDDRNTVSDIHWTLDTDAPDSLKRWTTAAPLPLARGHMSSAVVNGMAYAIGGVIGHDPHQLDVNDVHRYDPATNSWSAVAPLPVERSHAEPSTFVRDGKIIIVGGRSRQTGLESLADVTEYDPETNQWIALAPLPARRAAPIVASLGNRVMVAAGSGDFALPDTRVTWMGHFDSPWEPHAEMPVGLGEVAGGIIGDRLYLVGEDARETLVMNLGSGRWDPVPMHRLRVMFGHHHAAEVVGDKLWLIGGLGGGDGGVQVFDPATGRWSYGPKLPFPAGSSATAAIGDMIYVAGGIVGDSTTRLAARLDTKTGTWSPIAPMPRGRNHTAAGTDGNRFYVFGGRGPESGDSNVVANGYADVQIYDPATDSWTASGGGAGSPAPLPQARGGMGKAVYLDGEFWVFGGETLDGPGATEQGVYNRVDIYSPATNTWRAGPPMPTPRHGIFPLLHGRRIIVAGGGTQAGYSSSRIVEILDTRRISRP
jgi:N-acetylneuraminic acid mutarotase